MQYKYVDISDSVQIPVPTGLTPDEEPNYIASRIGFVNLDELIALDKEALRLINEGKLESFEPFLDELERDYGTEAKS